MKRRADKSSVKHLRDYLRGATDMQGETGQPNDTPMYRVMAQIGEDWQNVDLGGGLSFDEAKRLAQETTRMQDYQTAWIEDDHGNRYSNLGDPLGDQFPGASEFPSVKTKALRKEKQISKDPEEDMNTLRGASSRKAHNLGRFFSEFVRDVTRSPSTRVKDRLRKITDPDPNEKAIAIMPELGVKLNTFSQQLGDNKAAVNKVGAMYDLDPSLLYSVFYSTGAAAPKVLQFPIVKVKTNKAADLLKIFQQGKGGHANLESIKKLLLDAAEGFRINPKDKQTMVSAIKSANSSSKLEEALLNLQLAREGLSVVQPGDERARASSRMTVAYTIPWTEKEWQEKARVAARCVGGIELTAHRQKGLIVRGDHQILAAAGLVLPTKPAGRMVAASRRTGSVISSRWFHHLDGSVTAELFTRANTHQAQALARQLVAKQGLRGVVVYDNLGQPHRGVKAKKNDLPEPETKTGFESWHRMDPDSKWRAPDYHETFDEATDSAQDMIGKYGGEVKVMEEGKHPEEHQHVAHFNEENVNDPMGGMPGMEMGGVMMGPEQPMDTGMGEMPPASEAPPMDMGTELLDESGGMTGEIGLPGLEEDALMAPTGSRRQAGKVAWFDVRSMDWGKVRNRKELQEIEYDSGDMALMRREADIQHEIKNGMTEEQAVEVRQYLGLPSPGAGETTSRRKASRRTAVPFDTDHLPDHLKSQVERHIKGAGPKAAGFQELVTEMEQLFKTVLEVRPKVEVNQSKGDESITWEIVNYAPQKGPDNGQQHFRNRTKIRNLLTKLYQTHPEVKVIEGSYDNRDNPFYATLRFDMQKQGAPNLGRTGSRRTASGSGEIRVLRKLSHRPADLSLRSL